jgi:DNA-binding transcriptional LysR family regulator
VLAAPRIRGLDDLLAEGDLRIVVLRAGCSYRQMLEAALARRGVAAPRVLEFGTLEAIFACVEAGLGITLLPRALIGPVLKPRRLSVHRLPAGGMRVETVFVQRRGSFASSGLKAFLDMACRAV